MSITEIKEDLFKEDGIYAHCVSRDLKMGAGIAILFREKFGRVDELLEQKKDIGDVADLDNKVFYLITKERYFHKPTYDSLSKCLNVLHEKLKENEIKAIRIPRLGCGLDKLEWSKVKKIISEILNDIDVTVCYI